MEVIPWSQITSLGAGGMLAVLILWLVFKFLDKRHSESDRIVDILDNQTRILEHISDHTEKTKDDVLVIKTRLNGAATH